MEEAEVIMPIHLASTPRKKSDPDLVTALSLKGWELTKQEVAFVERIQARKNRGQVISKLKQLAHGIAARIGSRDKFIKDMDLPMHERVYALCTAILTEYGVPVGGGLGAALTIGAGLFWAAAIGIPLLMGYFFVTKDDAETVMTREAAEAIKRIHNGIRQWKATLARLDPVESPKLYREAEGQIEELLRQEKVWTGKTPMDLGEMDIGKLLLLSVGAAFVWGLAKGPGGVGSQVGKLMKGFSDSIVKLTAGETRGRPGKKGKKKVDTMPLMRMAVFGGGIYIVWQVFKGQ